MTNYSDQDSHCRVDFFKPSGKWYTNDVVVFNDYNHDSIHDAFKRALAISIGNTLVGMQAVCLEPHHKHSHPISIIWHGHD